MGALANSEDPDEMLHNVAFHQAMIKSIFREGNEPQHEISNNLVCATSKASDQPAHMRSLIRTFASHLNIL